MRRFLVALALATPRVASAHLIVDVELSVTAPPFVAAGAHTDVSVGATNLAYDPAFGVVVTVQLPSGMQFVSAGNATWSCSHSGQNVSCSAESINSGANPINVQTVAPSASGPVSITASVTTLGSIDPNAKNDNAAETITIYAPAQCSTNPPLISAPEDGSTVGLGHAGLAWSAVAGATGYRVWSATEGAAAKVIATTQSAGAPVEAEEGSTVWWVEADFAGCPPVSSPASSFISRGRPMSWTVADFAGVAGVAGHDDGPAAQATFETPSSVGTDIYGEVFVADSAASTVRYIDPTQNVSTMAGQTDMPGFLDGTGSLALLNHPTALTVSAGGYVFIADTGNQMIRWLYPKGNGLQYSPTLLSVAGLAGTPGAADGTGNAARFTSPAGIAVTSDYRMFVGDSGTDKVRQVVANGSAVTTVAGTSGVAGAIDGSTASALFNAPSGVAIDAIGTIYVADSGNNTIRRIDADGTVRTIAGLAGTPGFTDGTGSAARFNGPTALALDALGNIYVADRGNHAIRRISPSGFVETIIGSGAAGYANGPGRLSLLNTPTGVAFDTSGNLYIADSGSHVIRIATPSAQEAAAPPTIGPRRRASGH